MSTKKVLQDVDALLSDESKWTKNKFARTAEGDEIDVYDERATCWCLWGAVRKVCGPMSEYGQASRTSAIAAICNQITVPRATLLGVNMTPLTAFNDNPNTTFEQVKSVLARAIEMEEA